MPDISAVIEEAKHLNVRDEIALIRLVGLQDKAIELNPALKDKVDLDPKYDSKTMGDMKDIEALGVRVLKRWNKELYGLVCSNKGSDKKDRQAILDSINLGETAVIAAVAGALMALGVPAPIAAALAPLITKKFILPAKDELCGAWGEGIEDQA